MLRPGRGLAWREIDRLTQRHGGGRDQTNRESEIEQASVFLGDPQEGKHERCQSWKEQEDAGLVRWSQIY